LVNDSDAGQLQAGSQDSIHRSEIESNVLCVWWMSLAALKSDRHVQLLAKVLDDAADLIVCHVHPSAYQVLTGTILRVILAFGLLANSLRTRQSIRASMSWRRRCNASLSGKSFGAERAARLV
jgi:hypothetical protein